MCWPSLGPAERMLIAEDACEIIRQHTCAPACRLPHHSGCNHVFHIGRAHACSQVTRLRRNLAVRVHDWDFLQAHENIFLIDQMLLDNNQTVVFFSPNLPPANWFGMPNKRWGVVRPKWCSWVHFGRIEKFIIRQPPIGEKDDYDSENSLISDGLPFGMVVTQFWVFLGCFYASGKMKRDSWMIRILDSSLLPISEMGNYPFPGTRNG